MKDKPEIKSVQAVFTPCGEVTLLEFFLLFLLFVGELPVSAIPASKKVDKGSQADKTNCPTRQFSQLPQHRGKVS